MDSDETGTLAVDDLKLSPKFVGVFGWHLIGASVSESAQRCSVVCTVGR